MSTLRTFIAIDVPVEDRLRKGWATLRNQLLRENIKWVDDRMLHLTLFFMGDTAESGIAEIADRLDERVSALRSFPVKLRGLGTFGHPANPRVIWVGLEDCPPLIELKKHVNEVVTPLGFGEEEREFAPHITLGRVKGIRNIGVFRECMAVHRQTFYQESLIDKVIFYQSILKAEGSVYKPLKTSVLNG
jgi:2'-5' RNA ligase